MPANTPHLNDKKCSCPALLVSAPASRHGKTTLTAALARLHSRRGAKVRVFKCGPDFLDPMILERASGHPVYQLDLWIQGEDECRRLLHQAATGADLILVEGAMGLYDGEPSAADLAVRFAIPVLACIDASAMAGTFAAIAHGLATFRTELPFFGVFANRLGSARHKDILRNCLPPSMHWHGCLFRDEEISLPSRHLGLVQAEELVDLDRRLDRLADLLEKHGDCAMPPPVFFSPAQPLFAEKNDPQRLPRQSASAKRELLGLRSGIARDRAFSFIYQGNLDLLRQLGAELTFFSPLADCSLPEVDSLYFPGGYPELHLPELSANSALFGEIKRHHSLGKPILAECGGMLYMLKSLTGLAGDAHPLAGLLPGKAVMRKRLTALGSQEVHLPDGTLRGHTFHHSALQIELPELVRGTYPQDKPGAERAGEAVYRLGSLTASYIHLYFPSNPRAAVRLFKLHTADARPETVDFEKTEATASACPAFPAPILAPEKD